MKIKPKPIFATLLFNFLIGFCNGQSNENVVALFEGQVQNISHSQNVAFLRFYLSDSLGSKTSVSTTDLDGIFVLTIDLIDLDTSTLVINILEVASDKMISLKKQQFTIADSLLVKFREPVYMTPNEYKKFLKRPNHLAPTRTSKAAESD